LAKVDYFNVSNSKSCSTFKELILYHFQQKI